MQYKEVNMPSLDANENEAVVTAVYIKDGEYVSEGDLLFSIENSKATGDIVAESEGYIKLLVEEYGKKKTGEPIALIFESLDDCNNHDTLQGKEENVKVNATKKAIELAKTLEIELEMVSEWAGGCLVKEKHVKEYASIASSAQNKKMTSKFILKRERIVIIGAGKGAEVVIDILLDDPDKVIVGLVDDNVREFLNYDIPVLDCSIDEFPDKYGSEFYDKAIISIGANLNTMRLRSDIYKKYKKKGVEFTNAIASSAEIRRGVVIGDGNIIGAGCYIGTLTQIGDNNSISYGALIGHHNIIGCHNLIAPSVVTSGSDTIGDNCIIPAGVSIVNRVSIGNDVVVPIGYAISKSLEDGEVIKTNTSTSK